MPDVTRKLRPSTIFRSPRITLTSSSSTRRLVWRSVAEKSIPALEVWTRAVDFFELAYEILGVVDAGFGFGGARFGAAAEPVNLNFYAIFERILQLGLRFYVGLFALNKL